MPLDVIGLIFAILDPRDLLSLARTSKGLRAILMTKSNKWYWVYALTHVEGLPQCPPFLNEPSYASLVFSKYCHNCLKRAPLVDRVFIIFSARYCKECENERLVTQEHEQFQLLLGEIEDVVSERPKFTSYGYPARYHLPELVAFSKSWNARAGNAEAQTQLVRDFAASVKSRNQFAKLFRVWALRKKQARNKELRDEREAKKNAIIERLRTLGWGDELDQMDSSSRDRSLGREPLFKKRGPLTDRVVWANMQDEAVAWIELQRGKRLRRLRDKVMDPRFRLCERFLQIWAADYWPIDEYDDLPIPSTALQFRDYLLMPEIRSVLDVPDNVAVTWEVLREKLGPLLPGLVREWIESCKEELRAKLEVVFSSFQEGVDPMRLVTTAQLAARGHAKPMSVILWHGRLSLWEAIADPPSPDWKARVQWDTERIMVNPGISPLKARALIEACEMDADSATPEGMDKCLKRLTCDECTQRGLSKGGGFEVFNWRRAVRDL
ncbi:hypothetical protein BD309DRAFT_848319 [Dichomitus squalens]|nr:hypothetical protein BD309DRAFT_848319 [Dichomitus squalens]